MRSRAGGRKSQEEGQTQKSREGLLTNDYVRPFKPHRPALKLRVSNFLTNRASLFSWEYVDLLNNFASYWISWWLHRVPEWNTHSSKELFVTNKLSMELICFDVTNVVFIFGSDFYKHINGITTGSSLSLVLANIYMGVLEFEFHLSILSPDLDSICWWYFLCGKFGFRISIIF